MNTSPDTDMTLDPPGSIAIIGAGPLGIEAALYGRFLGYDITLLEAVGVGASMQGQEDEPLPMLPDRCLSPLAISALQAQHDQPEDLTLPTTVGEWIQDGLIRLAESDLLAGRLQIPARVTRIETVPIQPDEDDSEQEQDDSEDQEIPPDFRLRVDLSPNPIDVEAVIVAAGTSTPIERSFADSLPYFFVIGDSASDQGEQDLEAGRRQIVALYAQLAGRSDLDLYRPRRS